MEWLKPQGPHCEKACKMDSVSWAQHDVLGVPAFGKRIIIFGGNPV